MAIVAILMSLLAPSLRSLQKSQIKMQCLNNTRIIYATSLLYGDDHDDYLPRRNNYGMPHSVASTNYDLNSAYIFPYVNDRNIFFCPSSLLEVRNPQHPYYVKNHVTYSYFHDYKMGTGWKAPRPGISKTSFTYEKVYPLWGCLTLSTTSGFWFGHDRPIVPLAPEGQNACFIDGSAKWNDFQDLGIFYSNYSQSYYWPKPL